MQLTGAGSGICLQLHHNAAKGNGISISEMHKYSVSEKYHKYM